MPHPPQPPEDAPFTVAQAADYLQTDPVTVRRMISRGDLRAYRYGPRLIRIDRADLEKMRRPVTNVAQYRDTLSAGGAA